VKAQLLVFARFTEERIIEHFMFEGTRRNYNCKKCFSILNGCLQSVGLSWESCVDIHTEGTTSMVGSLKGLVSRAKKENENIIVNHWLKKTIGQELKFAFNEIITMENYTESKPHKPRLIAKLCDAMRCQLYYPY
jgi:hypothetical protein